MTTSGSNRELIDRAQGGDRDAFQRLFTDHADRIEYFVRLRLGAHLRQIIEIEDVLQETALRACRSVDRFRWQGEGSFRRWLEGIAEHVILENAKRGERRFAVLLEQEKSDSLPSQETLARRNERFERLQEAFDALSADHRRVILLARLRKLPLSVVAETMERSEAAAKQLLWRALQQLRSAFGETESLRLPDRRIADGGDQSNAKCRLDARPCR